MKTVIPKFFTLLVIIFVPLVLSGNGASFAKGNIGTGQLKLMNSENIQIVKEKLSIDLYKGYAEVNIEYTMENSGPDDVIRIGYPALIHDIPYVSKQEIENYSISDNGKKQKFEYIRTNQKLEWLEIPAYDEWINADEEGTKLNWYISNISFKKKKLKF